jgi:ParB-like chromosome segregation protein Spo0J
MHHKFEDTPLNKICSESSDGSGKPYNSSRLNNGKDIDDLKQSIRSLGLIQAITVYYNSATGYYEVLSGHRRLEVYVALNEENPNDGYDAIPSIIIEEPETEDLKKSLGLAEGLTRIQMDSKDLIKAVTDLYSKYCDYDIVQQKFGLTRYMIDKYVSLARLPERLVQAINGGEISPNTKSAENAAIRAVKALNWQKDGDVDIEDVIEFAKELAKGDILKDRLEEEAKNGGTVAEIIDRASKKLVKEKIKLSLSTEVFEKLFQMSDQLSEKPDLSNKIKEIAKLMNMDPEKLLMDAINDILSKYQKDNS